MSSSVEYIEVGERPWGAYYVLEEGQGYKIKKLVVNPGQLTSLQHHEHRYEHWIIVEGICSADIRSPETKEIQQIKIYHPNEAIYVPQGHIHRISNP